LPSAAIDRSLEPEHRGAKISVQAIKEQVPMIEDWSLNSPDTSAIENCRAIVTDEIVKKASEDSFSLKRVLTEEWDALDQKITDGLTASTSQRFKLCVETKGVSMSHLWHRTAVGFVVRAAERRFLQA
jgi:hypothetical protein